MSSATNAILEQIERGGSSDELIKKNPREKMSDQDLADLLQTARQLTDPQHSYHLLVYLFRISSNKDIWFSVEVLAQAMQHPVMTPSDRQSLLLTMRTRLDKIKDEITAKQPSDKNLRRYWLLEASYYAIKGATLAESGQLSESNQNYQIAQGIYEQLGLFQQAQKYKVISRNLLKGRHTGQLLSSVLMQPEIITPTVASTPVLPSSENGQTKVLHLPDSQPPATAQNSNPPSPANRPAGTPAPVPGRPLTLSEADALIAARPTSVNATAAWANVATIREPVVAQPEPAPLPPAASQPQAGSMHEIYQPLPDVLLEGSHLRIQGQEPALTEQSTPLIEQIKQQIEILAELQMQIKLYLERRSYLEQDIEILNKKTANLKLQIERFENKIKEAEISQADTGSSDLQMMDE